MGQANYRLAVLPGGDAILVGDQRNPGEAHNKPFVARVDPSGAVVWARRMAPVARTASVQSVQVAADCILLVGKAGRIASSSVDDLLLAKFDFGGTLLWFRTYAFPGSTLAKPIVARILQDGSIIAGLEFQQSAKGSYLLHLSSEGDLLDQLGFETPASWEDLKGLIEDSSSSSAGGLVVVTQAQPNFYTEVGLTRVSLNPLTVGDRYLLKIDSYAFQAVGAIPLNDGGFLVQGDGADSSWTLQDAIYAKVDSELYACGMDRYRDPATLAAYTAGLIESSTATDQLPDTSKYEWTALSPGAFTVSDLSVTLADEPIALTQYTPSECALQDASYVHPSLASSDACGGCVNGSQCVDEQCQCAFGFAGEHCQYLETDLPALQTQATATINSLYSSATASASATALTSLEILSQTKTATTSAAAVTKGSLVKASALAQTLATKTSSTSEEVEAALRVFSNLLGVAPELEEDTLPQIESIVQKTADVITANLHQQPQIQIDTPRIKGAVVSVASSGQPITVEIQQQAAVEIPAQTSDCSQEKKVVVFTARAKVQGAASSSERPRSSSPVLTVESICGGTKEEIRDLATPVKLRVRVQDSLGLAKLQEHRDGLISLRDMVRACFFARYYLERGQLAERECAVGVDMEGEFVEFETRHLSSFVSFFDTGAEVLSHSNYNVFWALPHITPASLKSNVGFWAVLAFALAWLLLGCAGCLADRRSLRGDLFFENLLKSTRLEEELLKTSVEDEHSTSGADISVRAAVNGNGSGQQKDISLFEEEPRDKSKETSTRTDHLDDAILVARKKQKEFDQN